MSQVHLKWVESNLMVGSDSRGNAITMGRSLDHNPEWWGLKPSDLLLLSAASCSTWDVVTILGKQRQPLESLEVRAVSTNMEQPPHAITNLHLIYHFKGDIDSDKAEKAIQLSQEKYCSVTNSLKAEITYEFEIE